MKNYIDYLNEIDEDDLFEGLLAYGMFSSKLPPIFTAEDFFAKRDKLDFNKKDKAKDYIKFESMRNTNVPRRLAIPHPYAYHNLCNLLKENWKDIRKYFDSCCRNQMPGHRVSRIHLRKMNKTKELFEMNYKNISKDGIPESDLRLGNKFVVHADISQCFPSIYTHALQWALEGKLLAKSKIHNKSRKKTLGEKLDACCRYTKNGETNGILIGPHAFNLVSEVVLCKVDEKIVDKGFKYIRNIDDYTCYAPTYEMAQKFIIELQAELRYYELGLNHKKTNIQELPEAFSLSWLNELSACILKSGKGNITLRKIQSLLDLTMKLVANNNENSAILNYAVQIVGKNADDFKDVIVKNYWVKSIVHLAVLYQYMIPLIDKYVFTPCRVSEIDVSKYVKLLYDSANALKNAEGMYYCIWYAIKYSVDLDEMKIEDIRNTDSCLLKLMAYLYLKQTSCRACNLERSKQLSYLINDARTIANSGNAMLIDSNWLFIYEVLPASDLAGDLREMKDANISFLKESVLSMIKGK